MAKKIVLIEDDEILSKVIYEDLQEAGYKVYRAFDGDEGLKMVKSEKPDMIILDLVLPKKDGFEVLKEIKKDNETKDIPVIIVSNLGQDVEIKRGMDLGAIDYLIKSSFSMETVINKIKKYLALID